MADSNPRNIVCIEDKPKIKRKPSPPKPRVEWVVQMGPFTDGQVSTPDEFGNMSGPYNVVIDPKSGDLEPFDADEPVGKNVIRKYLTINAQDTDVPRDFISSGDDYLITGVPTALSPIELGNQANEFTKVTLVSEGFNNITVNCEPMVPPEVPLNPQENPTAAPTSTPTEAPTSSPTETPTEAPTVSPPEPPTEEPTSAPTVAPTEAPTILPPEPPTAAPTVAPTATPTEVPTEAPTATPTEAPTEAPTATPTEAPTEAPTATPTEAPTPTPVPLDVENECYLIKTECPTRLDVLRNDSGQGNLEIISASANNGTVDIVEGQLIYTSDSDFLGADIIRYTVQDSSGKTAEGRAFLDVGNHNVGEPGIADGIIEGLLGDFNDWLELARQDVEDQSGGINIKSEIDAILAQSQLDSFQTFDTSATTEVVPATRQSADFQKETDQGNQGGPSADLAEVSHPEQLESPPPSETQSRIAEEQQITLGSDDLIDVSALSPSNAGTDLIPLNSQESDSAETMAALDAIDALTNDLFQSSASFEGMGTNTSLWSNGIAELGLAIENEIHNAIVSAQAQETA